MKHILISYKIIPKLHYNILLRFNENVLALRKMIKKGNFEAIEIFAKYFIFIQDFCDELTSMGDLSCLKGIVLLELKHLEVSVQAIKKLLPEFIQYLIGPESSVE